MKAATVRSRWVRRTLTGLSLNEALRQAWGTHRQREVDGYDQTRLDMVAQAALENGGFEDAPEEREALAEDILGQQA